MVIRLLQQVTARKQRVLPQSLTRDSSTNADNHRNPYPPEQRSPQGRV